MTKSDKSAGKIREKCGPIPGLFDKQKCNLEVKVMDCIFCKIAGGEIPSATLYEDEEFRVMLDIGPATRGHALILPKKHCANIYEMPEALVGKAFALAKKTAEALGRGLKADGVNILQNNGEAAGQTVFHFHIHVIPRYQGDGVKLGWETGSLETEEKEKILASVKALF